jgi:hypothetical protein
MSPFFEQPLAIVKGAAVNTKGAEGYIIYMYIIYIKYISNIYAHYICIYIYIYTYICILYISNIYAHYICIYIYIYISTYMTNLITNKMTTKIAVVLIYYIWCQYLWMSYIISNLPFVWRTQDLRHRQYHQ